MKGLRLGTDVGGTNLVASVVDPSFRILSKDFVPRTEIDENATVNIAINPTETNYVVFATDSRGYLVIGKVKVTLFVFLSR